MQENIGPYQIEAVLHKTANSQVYAISYCGETAVLKIPAKWDFGKEVSLLQSIQHSNIIEILKVDRKRRAYVMPFISNESLDDRLRGSKLSWPAFQTIASGIISALAALHQKEIIYADLSPKNIMIRDDHPVLIDFGLAHRVTDIMPIQGKGSIGFIPPEIRQGEPWSLAGDVYALGAILRNMIDEQWNDTIPEMELWLQVIEDCLVENRADRLQTAMAVQEQLFAVDETEELHEAEVDTYPRWVYVAGAFCLFMGALGGIYMALK